MIGLTNQRGTDRTGDRRTRRRLIRVIASMAVIVGLFSVAVPAAQAVGVIPTGSYPGTATTPTATVDPPNNGGGVIIGNSTGALLTSHDRTVYESPSYGGYWQYVCVTYNFQQYNDPPTTYPVQPGVWVVVAQDTPKCGWISPAATSMTVGGSALPLAGVGLDSKMTAVVKVTWQLQNGSVLGTKVYYTNKLTDYSCPVLGCVFGYQGVVSYVSY